MVFIALGLKRKVTRRAADGKNGVALLSSLRFQHLFHPGEHRLPVLLRMF
jgi:hypothetical protein